MSWRRPLGKVIGGAGPDLGGGVFLRGGVHPALSPFLQPPFAEPPLMETPEMEPPPGPKPPKEEEAVSVEVEGVW